ncbi:MAG: DUF58 domain-containing protein [Lachnospiraceae bacterium]|nr:DUF58 domain-containing protein [Lachnospiraceae bacterium]
MLLLLLAGAAAFYLLQRIIYQRYWNAGLHIGVEFEAHSAYEGDVSYLREEITNDKHLPLPALEVNLAMDRALKFSGDARENANVTDQSYRRDLFSLFMRQRVIRRLPFVCEKRGYYELTKADVIGYDFFFQRSFHSDRILRSALYVYPRLTDTRRIALLCRAVSGMIVTQNRLFPDPFCFFGIRDYHPSDPMHHINWKASAKGQGLLVNQFDSTTNIRLRIILDTEDSGIVRQEELTEEGIRIAASLGFRIVKERMELTVTGNGMNKVCLKDGAGQIQTLYRELSRIDIHKPVPRLWEELRKEKEQPQSGIIYVIISMNQDEDTARSIASMAENVPLMWVIPVQNAGDCVTAPSGGVHIFKWEMNRS